MNDQKSVLAPQKKIGSKYFRQEPYSFTFGEMMWFVAGAVIFGSVYAGVLIAKSLLK